MSDEEEPIYYTARHLLQALSGVEDRLLDLPLVLVHGKDLTKPNLVNGLIPAPIPVNRKVVEEKKPSLLAFAQWLENAQSLQDGQSLHDEQSLRDGQLFHDGQSP